MFSPRASEPGGRTGREPRKILLNVGEEPDKRAESGISLSHSVTL